MFVVQNEHLYQRKLRTFDFFVDLSLRFLSKILRYSKKNVHYRALMAVKWFVQQLMANLHWPINENFPLVAQPSKSIENSNSWFCLRR